MSAEEEFDELGESGAGPTWEQALHKLLDPKLVKFHTEILAPHPMSALDVMARTIEQEFGDEVAKPVNGFRDWYRDNMVAYKRKRAGEMVEGVKASAEAHAKSSADKLLGTLQK